MNAFQTNMDTQATPRKPSEGGHTRPKIPFLLTSYPRKVHILPWSLSRFHLNEKTDYVDLFLWFPELGMPKEFGVFRCFRSPESLLYAPFCVPLRVLNPFETYDILMRLFSRRCNMCRATSTWSSSSPRRLWRVPRTGNAPRRGGRVRRLIEKDMAMVICMPEC